MSLQTLQLVKIIYGVFLSLLYVKLTGIQKRNGRVNLMSLSLSNLKSLFYVPLYVSYKRNEAPALHSSIPHIRVVRSEEDKFHLHRIMRRSDLQRIMRSDPGMIQHLPAGTEDDNDSVVDKREAGGLGSHVRVIKSEELTGLGVYSNLYSPHIFQEF